MKHSDFPMTPNEKEQFERGMHLRSRISSSPLSQGGTETMPATATTAEIDVRQPDDALLDASEINAVAKMLRDKLDLAVKNKRPVSLSWEDAQGYALVLESAATQLHDVRRLLALRHHLDMIEKNGYGTPLCICANCEAYRRALSHLETPKMNSQEILDGSTKSLAEGMTQ